MISARMTGDWRRVVDTMHRLATTTKSVAIHRAVSQEALHWATEIKEGIRTQQTAGKAKPPWAPLADATKKKKDSTKMLIDTGTMMRSIGADKIGALKYFVGVKRGTKSADGEDAVNIAAVHEYGYSVKSGRSGGELIVIPQRSFIKPVEDELKKGLNDRLFDRYRKQVKSILAEKRFKKLGTKG